MYIAHDHGVDDWTALDGRRPEPLPFKIEQGSLGDGEPGRRVFRAFFSCAFVPLIGL